MPHDGALLEVADATAWAVFSLITNRVAQVGTLPAELRPTVADGAMHLMSFSLRCPVNRAALEVVVATNTVWCTGLVGERIAKETGFRP